MKIDLKCLNLAWKLNKKNHRGTCYVHIVHINSVKRNFILLPAKRAAIEISSSLSSSKWWKMQSFTIFRKHFFRLKSFILWSKQIIYENRKNTTEEKLWNKKLNSKDKMKEIGKISIDIFAMFCSWTIIFDLISAYIWNWMCHLMLDCISNFQSTMCLPE